MTTVSEVLEGQFRPDSSAAAGSKGGGTRARVRARVAVTDGDAKWSGVAGWLAARARTVWADLAGAWPWRGAPPTLAELVAARIPDRSRVPGENLALWLGWAVYNHAFLVVFAVAYPVLWWLAHPARSVLTAAVAVPMYFVWI